MADEWEEEEASVATPEPQPTYGGGRGRGRDAGERRPPREPRGDEWPCACGQSNFASRRECFKCKEPRPEGLGGDSDRRPAREPRADDWICPADGCGQNNFGNKTECFKCSEPRPEGAGRPVREPRPGDWTCPADGCGQNNFASKTECFKCYEPRPEGLGKPAREPRADDWTCPAEGCGQNNFGNKTACFKCYEPRPAGVGRPPREPRADDWICPADGCGQNNFGNKTACFKCSEPRPEGVGRPPREPRADDWTCPVEGCGQSNFSNRTECYKCKEPRPEGLGGDAKPTELYVPEDLPEGEALFEDRNKNFEGKGINFDAYDNVPIQASPNLVTAAAETFEEMNLRPLVLRNIGRMGYTKPTPIQKHGCPVLVNKQDLMACAQTGSGKTAAFLLPIINALLLDKDLEGSSRSPAAPEALIIAPTRELVMQIHKEVTLYSDSSIIQARNLYGGTTINHQKNKIFNGCNILVATPGRLKQFISERHLDLSKVRYFILDEADRMLDLGFMPDVQEIVKSLPPKGERVTGMFSATFPVEIQQAASDFMQDYVFMVLGIVGGACTDVEQEFIEVGKGEKRDKVLEILKAATPEDKVVVFCNTKKTADFLAAALSMQQISSTSIHGDRLQRQREEAIREFTQGKRKVLVATAVAARGLDIPKVSMVINYDMPKDIDEYVHRIGRTGRVGHTGRAITLFDPNFDSEVGSELTNVLKQSGQKIPDFLGTANGDGAGFGAADHRTAGAAAPPVAAEEDVWD